MTSAVGGFVVFLAIMRLVVLAAAVLAGIVALVDWLVRTRRVSPFGAVGRLHRRVIQPLLAPMERRIVRAGGLPSSAALWLVGLVVVGGILLLMLLGFLHGQLAALAYAGAAGPGGIVLLLAGWALQVLQLALLVRVVASWLRLSEWSPWIRWSVVLTEWLLRPLRRVIPPFGMLDITPLVAWLVLWLVGGFLLSLLASVVRGMGGP
ncbi:MAG TPA: YggT family protein [Gemmatimonadaceae bacterium]|nr:YggT family protein [Gemmatimonadaceae bacterium]